MLGRAFADLAIIRFGGFSFLGEAPNVRERRSPVPSVVQESSAGKRCDCGEGGRRRASARRRLQSPTATRSASSSSERYTNPCPRRGRWRGRGRTVSRSGSVRLLWPVSMGRPWTSALTRGLGTPAGVRGWPSPVGGVPNLQAAREEPAPRLVGLGPRWFWSSHCDPQRRQMSLAWTACSRGRFLGGILKKVQHF